MDKKTIPVTMFVICLLIMPVVAFSITTYYNQPNRSSSAQVGDPAGNKMAGELVKTTSSILYHVSVNTMQVCLSKFGSPTGNYYVGVWGNNTTPTNANYKSLFGIGDPSTLTVSSTACNFITFQAGSSYNATTGDVFGLFYNGGNGANFIRFHLLTSSSYNGTASVYTDFDQSRNGGTGAWLNVNTQDITMIVLGATTGTAFCDQPQNADILQCVLANGHTSGLQGASQTIGQSFTSMAVQVGLIQDGNNDPKTNGIGYLIVAIGIGIFVGILWVASRGQMTEIPTFVWFVGIIAIVGAITAFDYIDPTFLIITVIVVIAFAVAKARNVFGGQTLFAGESG